MVILVFNIALSQRQELKLIKKWWIMVAVSSLFSWVSVTIGFMSGKLNYYGWCCLSHTTAILSLRVHASTLDVWFSGMAFRDSVHHPFLLKHIQQSNQAQQEGKWPAQIWIFTIFSVFVCSRCLLHKSPY